MILIKKKKILFIIFAIFISFLSTFSLQTVETSSLPFNQSTIIIDAGHGLPDTGAEAIDGTTESNINLDISLKLQKLLEKSRIFRNPN